MNYQYKSIKFFSYTMVITWVSLLIAAYFSHSESLSSYQVPFLLVSLFTPFTVAMLMIFGSGDKELKEDFKKRLLNFSSVGKKYWLAIFFIMPVALYLATSLSLLFGQSADQFKLSPELTLWGGQTFLLLVILVLAPTFEELGWRGYGVDSLKGKRSVWSATMIFASLWIVWHIPLFFINGYYHNEILHENPIFALNFIVSLFPAAFLMNWIYYKSNRSIIAIIIFHVMLNLFSVVLQTEQFTKCLITIILIGFSAFILFRDKDFFYEKR